MFKHSCIIYFHWIILLFLRWRLDNPCFVWWNHQNQLFNLLPNYHHNPSTKRAIFSLLYFASMPYRWLNIPPTSCKFWIIIRFFYKISNAYQQLHLMGMSCSNYHRVFQVHTLIEISQNVATLFVTTCDL